MYKKAVEEEAKKTKAAYQRLAQKDIKFSRLFSEASSKYESAIEDIQNALIAQNEASRNEIAARESVIQARESDIQALRHEVDGLLKQLEELKISNNKLEGEMSKQGSKLRRAYEKNATLVDIYKQKDPAIAAECLIKQLI